MIDESLLQRVTILAIGVEHYQYLRPLKGPRKDIQNLHHLLIFSEDTAIYGKQQYIELINPTSQQLRNQINQYVQSRSANGDILILYFSGHGIPVGNNDFGFCTVDTAEHPAVKTVLPLTLFTFTDLLNSISIMDIIPVIIIDACYSGRAGKAFISSYKVISNMQTEITKIKAGSYALLCSCSETESTLDSSFGGVFSNSIFQVITKGLPKTKVLTHMLSLNDIYQNLSRKVESNAIDSTPRLFKGDTLPDFPLARNIQFRNQSYSYVGHLESIIKALWNNGQKRELSTSEIDKLCGKGAYGNHSKLSLEPWQLVENNPKNHKRKLSDRGEKFVKGELTIPKDIEKDPFTQQWIPTKNTSQVHYKNT